ncbi:MAG: hypothetical protein N838_27850 [Thiohalocapsa sp. PB-PSB1]|nr:MAG: hypothetical protein N838_27850 [Thiohalocapsa sp. PB-PSB1]
MTAPSGTAVDRRVRVARIGFDALSARPDRPSLDPLPASLEGVRSPRQQGTAQGD